MHSNPHMHTKKVRVRFKKMMHSSYRLFLSFTHIRNKRNCLSVNNTQLFGNCLWQLYEKNKTKLCDKERRVSGKHREVSQPTRLLIHTCERHPVLPGVQHQNRTIKFFPSLPSVEGLPSNSTPPIRDSMLHWLTHCWNSYAPKSVIRNINILLVSVIVWYSTMVINPSSLTCSL